MTREELKIRIIAEVKDLEGRLTEADYDNAIDDAIDYLRKDVIIIKSYSIQPAPSVIDLTTLPNWSNDSKIIKVARVVNNFKYELVSDYEYSIDYPKLYINQVADKIIIEYTIKPNLDDLNDFKIELIWLGSAFALLKLANSYIQSASPVVDAQVDYRTKREECIKQANVYFALYDKAKSEFLNRRDKSGLSIININLDRGTRYLFHK